MATSAPQNSTNPAEQYVGYTPDPSGRGTASLVISCLLTLILCVWSALHLNVPPRQRTVLRKVLLNIRWIIAGIYSPELVVFVAWRQWCSARILQSIVESTAGDGHDAAKAPRRRSKWSISHGFFASTGGFALELEGLDAAISSEEDVETTTQRITLTARGVALLAQCGHLPNVDEAEIQDKSKANDLAKATVLVQITWMLIQVIGRLAFRLPVTLLEVNTVAHVLCAFAMYAFWWHKPLLPNEPIVIRDEGATALAAFMYTSSEMSGVARRESIKSQTVVKTFFAHMNLYSKISELETLCFRGPIPLPHSDHVEDVTNGGSHPGKVGPSVTVESPVDLAQAFRESRLSLQRNSKKCAALLDSMREKEKGTAFFERRPRVLDKRPTGYQPIDADKRRWSLVQTALATYTERLLADRVMITHTIEEDGNDNNKKACLCVHLRPEQLVAPHIQNWPSADLLRNVDGLVVGMVLWLANFCYGGIHAAAWADHFPSTTEMWAWRASAVYIGFCGGLWVVLNFVVARYAVLNAFWEHWMDGEKTWYQSAGLGLLVFVCGLSLILARAFIVVEAFVSIRELSVLAYETPQWTNVFPHF